MFDQADFVLVILSVVEFGLVRSLESLSAFRAFPSDLRVFYDDPVARDVLV